MRYSYKQHCTVSLTVAESVHHNEWHLPTYDPRNEDKYHYKLHSLDIYFWTQKDALQFINGVRRVLPPTQVEVLDEPSPSQPMSMSPVVQQLEKVAISDSLYGPSPIPPSSHTASQDPVADGASTSSLTEMSQLPPPPPPPPASFTPMAYNPAAPAAPEAIKHREKTPPPDEDPLNPLAVAVAHDYQKQPFTPGFPPQSQFPLGVSSPGIPPNSINSPSVPSHLAGPPKQPGILRAATMPTSTLATSGLPYSPGFAPPPPPQPTTHLPGNHSTAALRPGGFSNYTYAPQRAARQEGEDYSIHQQLYRPTEVESNTSNPHPYQPKAESRGRLEENAGRLERGVSGMFKKFEKKFG